MKAESGTLTFEIDFRRPNELQYIGLPVEVRNPNLSLVRAGMTSESMELEPGQYFVISKMPAGQELLDQIEVKANEKTTAYLTLDASEESPHESEALQHFLVADRQKVLSAAEGPELREVTDFNSPLGAVQIKLFSGNLLSGNTVQILPEWVPAEIEAGLLGFWVSYSDSAQTVQLLQNGAPPLNVVLPVRHICRLFITSLVQGKYTMDVHLENPEADLLLRYSNKGFHQQTELMSQSVKAEHFLMGKAQDPISAAVGAYALLRFDQLERLHDWTENLRNWFEWLPDGSAIRGEHLSRFGQHEKAVEAFLELEERGLPVFSDGLSYATDRLSSYIESESTFFSESTVEKLRILLAKLRKFSLCADFREPFTTFTGLDINLPSTEPVKELKKDIKALDVLV